MNITQLKINQYSKRLERLNIYKANLIKKIARLRKQLADSNLEHITRMSCELDLVTCNRLVSECDTNIAEYERQLNYLRAN